MLSILVLTVALQPNSGRPDLFKDPLAISEEMKYFLQNRLDPRLKGLQRLESLVGLLLDQNELGFEHSNETKTAAQTFRDRNGNCLSFTAFSHGYRWQFRLTC
jgi:hypothetical protein